MNPTPSPSPAAESPAATLTALLVAPALTKLRPPRGGRILQTGIVAGLAVASYLLVSHYIVQTVQVVGSSMAPTLRNADRYLLDRVSQRILALDGRGHAHYYADLSQWEEARAGGD